MKINPAPCARHCESTAYEIEIRQLKAQLGLANSKEEKPERPEFTIADGDLDWLMNLTADMLQGHGNTDVGIAWHDALETVLGRLANNKQNAGKIVQPVLFQMRHRVGGQWKNIHLEHENFETFVKQTPDYEFRKLCVML